MTAQEHIEAAIAHLTAAYSSPLLIGASAADAVRSQVGLAVTFARRASDRISVGLVLPRPANSLGPERGCPPDGREL